MNAMNFKKVVGLLILAAPLIAVVVLGDWEKLLDALMIGSVIGGIGLWILGVCYYLDPRTK